MTNTSCFACAKHALGSTVPGGIIWSDDLTFAGHALPEVLDNVYLGYLMIEPKRHVEGWGDLTDDEAAALGCLINDLARVLKEQQNCEHVYSFVLGDVVPHLHIHLVPRYRGAPREYWGVKVDEWPDAPRGGIEEISDLSNRLRRSLELIRHHAPSTS